MGMLSDMSSVGIAAALVAVLVMVGVVESCSPIEGMRPLTVEEQILDAQQVS